MMLNVGISMQCPRGGRLGWQLRQVSCIDTARRWLPPIGILSALRPKSQDLPAGDTVAVIEVGLHTGGGGEGATNFTLQELKKLVPVMVTVEPGSAARGRDRL